MCMEKQKYHLHTYTCTYTQNAEGFALQCLSFYIYSCSETGESIAEALNSCFTDGLNDAQNYRAFAGGTSPLSYKTINMK